MLNRTVFPLGEFTKSEIREILRQESISVAESEESQELCFIPGSDYRASCRKTVFPGRLAQF